jgi:hypothetical protein
MGLGKTTKPPPTVYLVSHPKFEQVPPKYEPKTLPLQNLLGQNGNDIVDENELRNWRAKRRKHGMMKYKW